MVVISTFPPPTEGVKHKQSGTRLFVNHTEVGKGTVYIAESRLAWVDDITGNGFSVEYQHVSLHAVSRDLEAFPQECLYVMLDKAISIGDLKLDVLKNGAGDYGDDEELDLTEVRFVPDDKEVLDGMFSAMSHCQALHPDSQDSVSDDPEEEDDNDDDDEYYSDEESHFGGPNRINGLQDIGMEVDGQFDDAEGDPVE